MPANRRLLLSTLLVFSVCGGCWDAWQTRNIYLPLTPSTGQNAYPASTATTEAAVKQVASVASEMGLESRPLTPESKQDGTLAIFNGPDFVASVRLTQDRKQLIIQTVTPGLSDSENAAQFRDAVRRATSLSSPNQSSSKPGPL